MRYMMDSIWVLLSYYCYDNILSIFLPHRAMFKAHSEQYFVHG
jgi:hypothetical protein